MATGRNDPNLTDEERRLAWNAYMRDWRRKRKEADPDFNDYYDADYDREYRLDKRYGLSGTAWQEMYDKQAGLCAVCKTKEATCVDHCHNSNEVRALLCNTCNAGLGQFYDDPELLTRAIEYLHTHSGG